MPMNIGIVGLPNVDKSTLSNAMSAAGAESANFPFCTTGVSVGSVPIPGARLDKLAALYGSEKVVPTSLRFVDIAGLVKGAANGEGLGNQFLSYICQVDAVAQVVRCFDPEDVVHVDGPVNPLRDVEVIETGIIFKDLETVNQQGSPRLRRGLGEEDQALLQDLWLLTAEPVLFIGNVEEANAAQPKASPHYRTLQELAKQPGAPVIAINAAIEAEVSQLAEDERNDYLESMGLKDPGLHKVIAASIKLLHLMTYLTAGPEETRAWTITTGTRAPSAVGVIHSDFRRGLIKAEVIRYDDLGNLRSGAAVKSAKKMRTEGKEYVVQDKNVMQFRFNV